MKTSLRYGGGVLTFEVPDNTVFLQIREPEYTINKESFCTNFLFRLSASERDLSNVGIVVSDKTRLCGYPNYLPWIIEMLLQAGARKENISFYIAYGTHPRQTDEESVNAYGKIYYKYTFIHHDCSDKAAMITM